jgi:hypothetical protein
MQKTRNSIQSTLNALGIYQIIGGVLGLAFSYWIVNVSFSIILLLDLFFALGLYGFSIYCGILLIRKHKSGLIFSKINQLLQVIQLAMFGYGFTYISGVSFSLGLDITDGLVLGFNFGLSNWKVTVNSELDILMVRLNLIALFLIVAIDKWQKKLNALKMEEEIASIGMTETRELVE